MIAMVMADNATEIAAQTMMQRVSLMRMAMVFRMAADGTNPNDDWDSVGGTPLGTSDGDGISDNATGQ